MAVMSNTIILVINVTGIIIIIATIRMASFWEHLPKLQNCAFTL